MSRKRSSASIALAAVGMAVAAGCGKPVDATAGASTGGPLAVVAGARGVSVEAPRRTPWFATFVEPLLCTRGGVAAAIDRVRYDATAQPLAIQTWIRDLPDGAAPPAAIRVTGLSSGPMSVGPGSAPGTWRDPFGGTVVDTPCPSAARRPTQQLVIVMKVGRHGGRIAHTYIDYTSGGARHTLRLDRVYTACGTEVGRRPACSSRPTAAGPRSP